MAKKTAIPTENTLIDLAEFFKTFGDSTRIKILFALLKKDEASVGEISEMINISQSAVSHQLRILKASRLIKNVRSGKSLIYSLNDFHVVSILGQGIEHIGEKSVRKRTTK